MYGLRSLPSSPVTFALCAATLALTVPMPLAAQTPRIRPDTRGYQATMMIQQAHRERARTQASARPTTPAPQPTSPSTSTSLVGVRVSVPTAGENTSASTTYVTIQGPDGEVRRFPLAQGVEVQYRRQNIVLRPGESTTIRLIPR